MALTPVPSWTYHRLDASTEALFSMLCGRRDIYLQARNHGGGLGKKVERLDPCIVGEKLASFDAGNGFSFAIGDVIGFHASEPGSAQGVSSFVDLEFRTFAAGVSMFEIVGGRSEGMVSSMISLFGDGEMCEPELRKWRALFSEERSICSCCAEKAAERAEFAAQHPLFDILTMAAQSDTPFEFRLLSEHTDLSSRFVPVEICTSDGFLITSSREGDSAVHFDMRMVHALAIDRVSIDGTYHSVAKIFDSHGEENFQILSENAEDVRRWKSVCEAAKWTR